MPTIQGFRKNYAYFITNTSFSSLTLFRFLAFIWWLICRFSLFLRLFLMGQPSGLLFDFSLHLSQCLILHRHTHKHSHTLTQSIPNIINFCIHLTSPCCYDQHLPSIWIQENGIAQKKLSQKEKIIQNMKF